MSGLHPVPLTAEAFLPFGEVLDTENARRVRDINQNMARRFDMPADISTNGGEVGISMFRAVPCSRPLNINMLECHPRGSQAFLSARSCAWLVVVAPGGDEPQVENLKCFLADGGQGVNYRPGTWHHPLLVLEDGHDFWVVDRTPPAGESADANLREYWFSQSIVINID